MRTLFATIGVLFASITVTAQVSWKVRGGLGGSTFIVSTGDSWHLSYRLGGGATIPLGEHWRLNPSLFYVQKGNNFRGYYGSEQINEAHYWLNLHYLELPITAGYKVDFGKRSSVMFYAGPYVAYGLQGKAGVSIDNTDYKQTFEGNLFAQPNTLGGIAYNKEGQKMEVPKLHRVDVGIHSGVEFDLNRWLVGVEMSYGITPISNEPMQTGSVIGNIMESILFGTTNTHHFALQAIVGYRF